MGRPATSVIERFPKHELAIERLVRTSEIFRSMCEDYAVGVEALRRWERANDATDPERAVRIAELRESLAELEGEMLEMVEQGAASRSRWSFRQFPTILRRKKETRPKPQ